MRLCHEGDARGHLSGKKTSIRIGEAGFFWPNLFNDVRMLVKNCDKCQRTGNITKRHEMPLTGTVIMEIFDVWGMDFMGPFPISNSYEYILVAVEYTSKWIEDAATRNCTADTVVKFLQKIVSRFGVPRIIISDNGTHFVNAKVRMFMKKNGIQHKRATPYHPQTSG